jgi:hypothetical protein
MPVSSSTNCSSSGLTSSPIEISLQSRPTKAGSVLFGGGGLSIRLWMADWGREGCRRARGDPGGPRRVSLKLCLCWWFEATICETRSVFLVEFEWDSVLDRGEAVFAPLLEVSDPSWECSWSAMEVKCFQFGEYYLAGFIKKMQWRKCCLIYWGHQVMLIRLSGVGYRANQRSFL